MKFPLTYFLLVRIVLASFPGLHAQLLSLEVRTASNKSWAWRPGNEATLFMAIVLERRALSVSYVWLYIIVLSSVVCYL